jgi:hypothetical protein
MENQMLTITGKVIKKERKNNPVKVDLLVEDSKGEVFNLQVRPKTVLKLVEIDTGCMVEVVCSNKMGKDENGNKVNNLILEDLKLLQ